MTACRSRRIIPDATGWTRTKYDGSPVPVGAASRNSRTNATCPPTRTGFRAGRARLLEVEEKRVRARLHVLRDACFLVARGEEQRSQRPGIRLVHGASCRRGSLAGGADGGQPRVARVIGYPVRRRRATRSTGRAARAPTETDRRDPRCRRGRDRDGHRAHARGLRLHDLREVRRRRRHVARQHVSRARSATCRRTSTRSRSR